MGHCGKITRKEKEIGHVIQSEAKDLVNFHVYAFEIFRTEASTTCLPSVV